MNHENDVTGMPAAIADEPDRAVIDALLDGERVAKASLRDALGRTEVRDYFVDMLLLRQLAIEMESDTFPSSRRRPTLGARAVRWVAAAAVIVGTAAASYVIGRDGPTAVAIEPAISIAAPVSEAPAPTQTVRFERGRNWISNLEEN